MTSIILIVFAVVVVLTLLMFFSLKRIVGKISEETKVYFVMKLQSYDELIEEKEKKLSELESKQIEIKDKEEITGIVENKEVVIAKEAPKYQFEGLSEIIKQIEQDFNYDYKNIIYKFIEFSNRFSDNNYNEAKEVRKLIIDYGLFNISIKNENDQLNLVNSLGISNSYIYKIYFDNYKKFDINNFMKIVDIEIYKNDPHIYVSVGNETETYNMLSDKIILDVNKKIIKGIKIIYRGIEYDYSLT